MKISMHLLSKNKLIVLLNEDNSLLCSTNDNNDKAHMNQSQTCNWLHVNTFELHCWLLAHVSHSEHFVRMQILNCWAVHTHETSSGNSVEHLMSETVLSAEFWTCLCERKARNLILKPQLSVCGRNKHFGEWRNKS